MATRTTERAEGNPKKPTPTNVKTRDESAQDISRDRSPNYSIRRRFITRIRNLTSSTKLLYVVTEIAIVTVGILIAFALNTWWEGHKQAAQEQQHLQALANDFEQNIGQLQELVKAEERVAENSFKLLQVARSSQSLPPDELRRLIGGVFSSRRFEPVMGAYEALVNSSGLTLVSDETLRASLANFAASVMGRYGERFGDEMYFSIVRDFVGRLEFADLLLDAPATSKSYFDLLADKKFQDYLAVRHLLEKEIAAKYRELLRQSEAILELLRHEIK
jgi:hypothetical protein